MFLFTVLAALLIIEQVEKERRAGLYKEGNTAAKGAVKGCSCTSPTNYARYQGPMGWPEEEEQVSVSVSGLGFGLPWFTPTEGMPWSRFGAGGSSGLGGRQFGSPLGPRQPGTGGDGGMGASSIATGYVAPAWAHEAAAASSPSFGYTRDMKAQVLAYQQSVQGKSGGGSCSACRRSSAVAGRVAARVAGASVAGG